MPIQLPGTNPYAGLKEGLLNFVKGLERAIQEKKQAQYRQDLGLVGQVLEQAKFAQSPEGQESIAAEAKRREAQPFATNWGQPKTAMQILTEHVQSPQALQAGVQALGNLSKPQDKKEKQYNVVFFDKKGNKHQKLVSESNYNNFIDTITKQGFTLEAPEKEDEVTLFNTVKGTTIRVPKDQAEQIKMRAPNIYKTYEERTKPEESEFVDMSKTLDDGRVKTIKHVKIGSSSHSKLLKDGYSVGTISGQAKDEKPETTDMTKIENGRKKRISNVIIGSDRYNKYLRKGYVEGDIEEMGGSAKSLSEKYDEWVQARTKAGLITTAKDIDGFFRKGGKSLAEKFEEFKKVFRKNLHRDPTPEEIRQRLISDPFGILGPAESQQTPPPPINSYDGILTR